MEIPSFKLNGRIWIEMDEEKVLGHGRVELLERIHASGSIRQAALQMKMSYKQAWDLVNHMNDGFKQPLVISKRGGKGGGVALLTPFGLEVIGEFKDLQQKFSQFLDSNSKK
ncbi:winged helix-turn-helix domain-containing protein [Mucilaginibacter sp. P19]|uniref:Molybdate transport system regulatory protein n=2 Tax=Mucilaginibacter TaxID=423349 RepID=A0A1G8ETZ2_9SPHI|nr:MULTISPECIES: winged helix-turn-helix domain-containing protein [Mucilaginibacter]QTE34913.1 winged helix-turn-helix domain-containing protein [Mucilaginibacter gossypii]RAV59568.1 LysR family transcriptional regulator [Mucilaginibacter rubeus]SDH73340.1 molybdate transport system regulatory protein [Mucilaginibacter gossypii]